MTNPSGNYLPSVLYLIIIVVAILLLLNFIPSSFIDKYNLRPIDILSDIKKDTLAGPLVIDTIPEPPRLDTCKTGLVCFDDYSSQHNGLDAFFNSLSGEKLTRIAFFGDSFIEGDIFSGDLREKLQEKFGGKGVGMLPLSSQLSSFRQTVVHQYGGWTDYSLLDTLRTPKLGISGHVFLSRENSWVYYAGSKRKADLDSCQRVSVFYNLKDGLANLNYKINKTETGQQTLISSDQIQRLDIEYEKIGNINLSFSGSPQLYVYGVSMEDTSGVILDNYSMRGISGSALKGLSLLPQFDSLLNYDLIILEYGLNVMEAKRTNYQSYQQTMVKTVKYLQACFPEASFLLIGVSDRSMRVDGAYQTMPAVPAMIAAQKHICAETGIAFWNLFEAMGGENSMIELVKSSPPKANKDYTHLTFKGGEFIGNLLYETIVFEKEKYDEKKAYYKKINK